ncbi:hypothetical protein AHAS_Ahas19G0363600 [Arachis hypogaea]
MLLKLVVFSLLQWLHGAVVMGLRLARTGKRRRRRILILLLIAAGWQYSSDEWEEVLEVVILIPDFRGLHLQAEAVAEIPPG